MRIYIVYSIAHQYVGAMDMYSPPVVQNISMDALYVQTRKVRSLSNATVHVVHAVAFRKNVLAFICRMCR